MGKFDKPLRRTARRVRPSTWGGCYRMIVTRTEIIDNLNAPPDNKLIRLMSWPQEDRGHWPTREEAPEPLAPPRTKHMRVRWSFVPTRPDILKVIVLPAREVWLNADAAPDAHTIRLVQDLKEILEFHIDFSREE